VDVAGDALSTVIITKLPFKVPTEPIAAARSEQMRLNGINPFLNYFLPQAVLRFRQGCGRLIRTKTDRGLILICDKRIMERSYGKFFIQSLPACSVHYDKLQAIEQEVKLWF
jgi:ATP-dependent DNA helicase DinG